MDGVIVQEMAPLRDYTTFRLGGECRSVMSCDRPESLQAVVQDLVSEHEPYVLIGSGSNLLISDEGYEGVVVRYCGDTPRIEQDSLSLHVDAGTVLDDLAKYAADLGLVGLNCCTGIPGTVGGAIVGNAGAWGKQIGDVLDRVTVMDRAGEVREAAAGSLGFGYRRSDLQRSGELVLSARFRLQEGERETLKQERAEILALRAEKHPNLEMHPCIGSIFRNIEPSSAAGRRQAAGWFLEQAGAKDLQVGGARVYEKHANIIVKGPDCTAQDVRDLATRMADAVREHFDFQLEREVRFLGRFRGEEHQPMDRFF